MIILCNISILHLSFAHPSRIRCLSECSVLCVILSIIYIYIYIGYSNHVMNQCKFWLPSFSQFYLLQFICLVDNFQLIKIIWHVTLTNVYGVYIHTIYDAYWPIYMMHIDLYMWCILTYIWCILTFIYDASSSCS